MATLTEITRQLKETFEGYSVPEMQEELQKFKQANRKFDDVETIRIGDMNYIVVNSKYKREEFLKVSGLISPLFYNSIKKKYAIIDTKTSSTLIDEVYSRVTYIQRVCGAESNADEREMKENFKPLFGDELEVSEILVENESKEERSYAELFQLQLILDSRTSAMPDTYGFMWRNGEVKEIPAGVIKNIRRSGEVSILKDRDLLEKNSGAIQEAVFKRYSAAELDIDSVTVKSIFEIRIPVTNVHPQVKDKFFNRIGRFNAVYLAGKDNEFKSLNANVHTCNLCHSDLVDVADQSKRNPLHLNIDVVLPKEGKNVYALGCEECLEQCPSCGSWHFDYRKFLGKKLYDEVALAPGRSFIKRLHTVEANYCSCRECIDWVYDERSGTKEEHDIIPIEKVAFINYAGEQIASYQDYEEDLSRALRGAKGGKEESEIAHRTFESFKNKIARRYDMDTADIIVTSTDMCRECVVCGGTYYMQDEGGGYDSFRCGICRELVSEKRHMVTRNDGMIFMRRVTKQGNVIEKYTVTKLGNLKKLSSHLEKREENITEDKA